MRGCLRVRRLVAEIVLPWPPSSLSGHAKGNWHGKSSITARYRRAGRMATLYANPGVFPGAGDIRIHFRFEPPNHRGDRVNFPGRLKPMIDGIADALRVNDKRFLPSYEFGPVFKGGRVLVTLEAA